MPKPHQFHENSDPQSNLSASTASLDLDTVGEDWEYETSLEDLRFEMDTLCSRYPQIEDL